MLYSLLWLLSDMTKIQTEAKADKPLSQLQKHIYSSLSKLFRKAEEVNLRWRIQIMSFFIQPIFSQGPSGSIKCGCSVFAGLKCLFEKFIPRWSFVSLIACQVHSKTQLPLWRRSSLCAHKLRRGRRKTKAVGLQLPLWNTAGPQLHRQGRKTAETQWERVIATRWLDKVKGMPLFFRLCVTFWSRCRRHVFPVTWVGYLQAERSHCCYYPEACAVTPRGAPSVVKLMQYPSSVRRQLRPSRHSRPLRWNLVFDNVVQQRRV